MGLDELIIILRKRKMLLIITTLVAFLVSALVSIYLIKPTFQASTTLILTKTDNEIIDIRQDYYTVLLNTQLVKTYQELARSEIIMKKVSEQVDKNIKVEQLKNMVDIQIVGETGLIRLNVEHNDPEKAAMIANTLSKVFVEEIPRLLKINNVQIVDEAEKPLRPFKPNIMFNIILAVVIGLILGIGVAFLLEYLDNTLHTDKDVEKYLNLPVLSTIPQSDQLLSHISFENASSIVAETYRILRTNIVFSGINKAISTLLVTSSIAHEGKSTIASNLGVVFAQTGQKVIVIDADLRLPTQHKILGITQMPGLTNVVLDELSLDKALKSTETPGLFVLTSGPLPPNPAELLGSEKMKEIITNCRALADIVIVDSPPLVPVTDAAILSNLVDGTLLVIRSGKCNIELAQRAKEQMQKAQARIFGTVLNKG